ncbi:MAG: CBS domain-containing protein, partial [Phycisphaerae bacterium]
KRRKRPDYALRGNASWTLCVLFSSEDPPVQCSTVPPATLAVECLRLMRDSEITVLVVSESGTTPDGIIRLQDLVRAGLG